MEDVYNLREVELQSGVILPNAVPGKSWFTILRMYGPLEPWIDKTWRPSDRSRGCGVMGVKRLRRVSRGSRS